MLVITGRQRSGTTAVASLFHHEGYLACDHHDEVGGFESAELGGFYRKYLGDATFPFDDLPVEEISPEQFRNLNRPVVKFSFLMMNPALIHIWHKFRPATIQNDCFLIMYRPAEEIAKSKHRTPEVSKRFAHDSNLLKQTVEALKWNFKASLRILDGYGYQYQIYKYEELLERFTINMYLWQLPMPLRISRKTWETIIDKSKRHIGG